MPAREDIAPEHGRRMVVRCLSPDCRHAALVDQRRIFGASRDWPMAGPSTRFRCRCGGREAEVSFTRNPDAPEGPIHPSALALWF